MNRKRELTEQEKEWKAIKKRAKKEMPNAVLELRLELNISQAEMAGLMEIPQGLISYMENDMVRPGPHVMERLIELANRCEIDWEYFEIPEVKPICFPKGK